MKAILLGLDGGDWRIFNQLINEGLMPNLKELKEKGLAADLISTIPPSTPQAWASILTGLNAGRHGVFGFASQVSNTERRFNSLKSMQGKKLWHYLNEAGLSCGVVNVPMTYPPEPVNGFMVSGFMTPKKAPVFTYPQQLGQEIKERFPAYELDLETPVGNLQSLEFINRLDSLNKTHFEAALWLAKKYQPDVLFFVSVLPDRIQHLYYKHLLSDKSRFNLRLKQSYKLLDQLIGRLIEELEPKKIFIVSDHGFALEEGVFFANDWLYRHNFLSLNVHFNLRLKLLNMLKYNLYKINLREGLLKQMLALAVTKIGGKRFTKKTFKKQARTATDMINWSKTKAFAAPVYQQGIYINKQLDGDIYLEIRGEVLAKLQKYFTQRDQKLKVWKKEEVYDGPFLWAIPDLILSINNFQVLCQDNIFFADNLLLQSSHQGVHSVKGVFVAYGKGINKLTFHLKKLNVVDVLPTFLKSLQIETAALDGKALLLNYADTAAK